MPSDEQKKFIDKTVLEIINSIKKDGIYNEKFETDLNEVIETIYGF